MSSKPIPIRSRNLSAQRRRSDTENEGSENNSVTHRSSYPNSPTQANQNISVPRRSISSSLYLSNENLLLPFLSSIYTEITTYWCQIDWLHFADNQRMTFLVLNPTITDYLTVQTALDDNRFIIPEVPLLNQPECLLVRTEYDHQSLLSPNGIISLRRLFSPGKKPVYGKLMAIICQNRNMKIMFYQAMSNDHWSILYKDLTNSSQSSASNLSDKHQKQFETILDQTVPMNLIDPTQLPYPLSALYKHPIIFVYLVQ